jgi:peptidoglycan/LPS O-acetylase OafA/YrhL
VVLLFHANAVLRLPHYLGHDVFALFEGGKSGVDYFFVLSGFVMMLVHDKDIGQGDRVGVFLWKRFQRIYPPLWVALLLALPVVVVGSAAAARQGGLAGGIISAFLITPWHGELLLPVEWTLRHEVLFYAMCALVIWRPRPGVVVAGLWVALSLVLPFMRLPFPLDFLFSPYHLLFALGVLAAWLYKRQVDVAPMAALIVGGLLFAGAWGALSLGIVHDDDGVMGAGLIAAHWIFGLGATLIMYGGVTFEARRAIRFPRWAVFLGEASYSIYLVHFLALSLMAKVLVAITHHLPMPDAVIYAAAACGALVLGIAFHLAVEKPLAGLMRRAGGKFGLAIA